jgi:hypothetical protein
LCFKQTPVPRGKVGHATRRREESRQKLATKLLLESEREISYHFAVERVLEISPRTSTQHPGPQLGTKPGGTKP